MIEGVAGTPAPDPEDGRHAATSGGTDAPATSDTHERAPEWLDAATDLLGRDPGTGLLDTDRLLEMLSWQARALFSHAKTDRPHHTKDTLLAQIQATQALINTVTAVQHVRVAQYAATAESDDPDAGHHAPTAPAHNTLRPDTTTAADTTAGTTGVGHREHAHPLGHVCEFTDTDLAPAMRWGPFQAVRRINDAVDAVTKTPRLLDEMGAGCLAAAQVAEVTGELIEAGEATCRQVQDRVLELGIGSWTARQAKNRTRTLVRRLDPPAARHARTKQLREQVGSFTRPGPETGLTEWTLVLPTGQALPAIQAVEDLARRLHQDQTGDKSLHECRVDVFTDLLLGRAEITTIINVLVPVKTSKPGTGGDGDTRSAPGGDAHAGGADGDTGSVADSWLETILADYNWDAALRHLSIDLARADTGSTGRPATTTTDASCEPGHEPTTRPAAWLVRPATHPNRHRRPGHRCAYPTWRSPGSGSSPPTRSRTCCAPSAPA